MEIDQIHQCNNIHCQIGFQKSKYILFTRDTGKIQGLGKVESNQIEKDTQSKC